MTTTTTVDVLIVGGGAMGSAAAWQLGLRGRDVVLLERFAPGHLEGASHGASRNFNVAYDRQPYLDLLVESGRLWGELEAQAAVRLLDRVGIVNHGGTGEFPELAALHSVGIPAQIVAPAEANLRWPELRFATDVLFNEQAGRLNADASVAALQSVAAARGVDVRHGARALAIEPHDTHVLVTTDDAVFRARVAIVTLGAWSERLLGALLPLPPLVVTQEQPAHFALRGPGLTADWPGFNHRPRPTGDEWWYSGIYGMATPGQGVKAGWHGVGPVTDPDRRSYTPEPAQLAALQRYAAEWLPGADPEAIEPISCTYTTTPDADFIVDRRGPLVVGAGFSGHGFKFTPSIGRLLADLAVLTDPSDAAAITPAGFALGRF